MDIVARGGERAECAAAARIAAGASARTGDRGGRRRGHRGRLRHGHRGGRDRIGGIDILINNAGRQQRDDRRGHRREVAALLGAARHGRGAARNLCP
ncbi:MAG: hypothetical protein U0869_19950 [Chloroflexota bacterium]